VTDAGIIDIAIQTMIVVAKLAAPILVVSLAIGVAVSLVQAMTQVQEVTLTFVPKLLGVAAVIALGGNWMLAELVGFTRHLFDLIPSLIARG
jgi:flagellar biosynthetic protein FliQ